MPFVQRYSDVKKGGIVFTGNTFGLSKAVNQNAPGTQGSIGAFTSLNAALQVETFPAETSANVGATTAVGANVIVGAAAIATVLIAIVAAETNAGGS